MSAASGKGRRPRGGKITTAKHSVIQNAETESKPRPVPTASLRPNVILRLRHITPANRNIATTSILTYTNQASNNNSTDGFAAVHTATTPTPPSCIPTDTIEAKLRDFNARVRAGDSYKAEACYWDTCPFYTPPVYVPLHVANNTIHTAGYYCSPECAAAAILRREIEGDAHEQLSLLNTLYTPVYMLEEPIVPAPNPRKMLTKFGGPLTVEEYRQSLRSGKQLQALPYPVIKNVSEIHLVAPKGDIGKILKGRRKLVSKPLNT